MATVTTTARLTAIRLYEKVRKDPELAKSLGLRVDFKTVTNEPKINDKSRKDADHV